MPDEAPPATTSDSLSGHPAGDLLPTTVAPNPGPGKAATPPGGWQPPQPEELQAMLPQFEVISFLGRGGMGAVYRANQLSLERPVAIKILPPGMADDDASYAERFRQEAMALARLRHLGIVSVYDFGQTQDGMYYIAMELIEGTDVARMVAERGRLHSDHAMAITAHVCDALQYAHDHQIIHRDIKPSNIMVGNDGSVKVTDFGLAKFLQDGGQSGLTRSGMALGTLQYMAPEALTLGVSVDHRADIYAVGVMLYYMLTGQLPQGMFEMPSLQVPGLDPRYDTVISRALRNDRELRYQSASDMRRDLDAMLTRPITQVAAPASQTAATSSLPQASAVQRASGQFQKPQPRPVSRPVQYQADINWGFWVPVAGTVLALGAVYFWLGQPRQKAVQTGPVVAVKEEHPPAAAADGIRLPLLDQGAMSRMGGYRPQMAKTSAIRPDSILKAPGGITEAEYGELKMGPASTRRTYAFIIDQPDSTTPRLFMDSNGNGDLTDDPQTTWKTKTFKNQDGVNERSADGDFQLELNCEGDVLLVHLHAYRFDRNAPKRPHDVMMYYSDYARLGSVTLGGKDFQVLLADDDCKGDFSDATSSFRIDINGNGKFDFTNERFRVKDAFNIGGITYELSGLTASGSSFQIVRSSRTVAESKPAPVFTIGKPALPFEATTLSGTKVSLNGSFKGKIVLLDFWASWCPPCIKELPHVMAAYEKHHAAGLEILGISLDEKEKLPAFLTERKIPWPQICDGLVWKAALAQLYNVHSIPASFLVDGDSGVVLAIGLRGDALEPGIAKALAEKKR